MLKFKITTVIVEKDQKNLSLLLSKLKKIEEISVVGTTLTMEKGILLLNTYNPQLLIVNTDINEINGLEFIRIIQSRNIFTEVVFISKDESYAFKSLALKPLDYWIQPLDIDEIKEMVIRFKIRLTKKELFRKMEVFTKSQSVGIKRIFKQKKGIIILFLKEIIYCKAELGNSKIVLQNGKSELIRSSISEILETINNDDFVKISRTHFINKTYIRKVDKRNLKCIMYFDGNTWELPASKNTINLLEKLNAVPIY